MDSDPSLRARIAWPRGRGRAAAAALGLVVLLFACVDRDRSTGIQNPLGPENPPPPPPQGLIVSDPAPRPAASASRTGTLAVAAAEGDSFVYVSLVPGTAPEGVTATVRNLASGLTVTTVIGNGGFDPVPAPAGVGDTVEVMVRDAAGRVVLQLRAAVAARRPPVIVRTDPPPKKRDVPLNARIVVVFSEPMDVGTITPTSVQLLRAGQTVGGSVTLTPDGLEADFEPAGLLDPETQYTVVITAAVTDVGGQELEQAVTASFTTGLEPASVAKVVVAPDSALLVADTSASGRAQLTATPVDSTGTPLVGRGISWGSSDTLVARVDTAGLVRAVAAGSATVAATSEGVVGTARITVLASMAVDTVVVTPQTVRAVPGALTWVGLRATVRDADGKDLWNVPVSWSTSPPAYVYGSSRDFAHNAVVRVGATAGSFTVTATARGRSGTTAIQVDYVTLDAISVGTNGYLCGLTHTGAAYCDDRMPDFGLATGGLVAVAGGLTFTTISTGEPHCALTSGGVAYCWEENSTVQPVRVPRGLTFAQISAGLLHTCGLTASGVAYCWGGNSSGQLGDGTTTGSPTPVPVSAAGLVFTQISAGWLHTCGLTTDGTGYCWGYNEVGQLGDSSFSNRSSPVVVAGGLRFTAVSAGGSHTCALTTGGPAYCWGGDTGGLLGDGGGSANRSSPVPVALPGGVTLTQIDAGSDGVTCGLATDDATYCWGYYYENSIGYPEVKVAPTRVPGGLTFKSVSSGYFRSCGVTPDPVVYCWEPVLGDPGRLEGQR